MCHNQNRWSLSLLMHICINRGLWVKSYVRTKAWNIYMKYKIRVNNGLRNGLLPDGIKPLPQAISIYHQLESVAFTQDQFYRKRGGWSIHNTNSENTPVKSLPHFSGVNELSLYDLLYLWSYFHNGSSSRISLYIQFGALGLCLFLKTESLQAIPWLIWCDKNCIQLRNFTTLISLWNYICKSFMIH